ncbi:GbsR/MarR family transcriptional regulator [Virgibacillus phasianinus]|uniref:GbsR/MarR family transcriptional regulator n=1 Tax=Virgibacillus phasianinus TaxID=2017483 RepID=UPI003CCB8C4E
MKEKPFDKTIRIEEQFVDKIAENMHTFGISTTVGRVLGTIYMNRKPMTLDELSESIGMSKTRMSQVVREMLELNIAEKVFEKGVRKDLYNVERDYYQTFISLFTSNWRKAISKSKMFEQKLQRELANIEKSDSLDEETEQKVNELLKETRIWLDYYDWIDRLTEFFESGEVFKHVPIHEEK